MAKQFAFLTDAAIAFASLVLALIALSPTIGVVFPFSPGYAVVIIIYVVIFLFVVKFVVGVVVDRQTKRDIEQKILAFNETTKFRLFGFEWG